MIISMTENNSKHLIEMTLGSYKLYLKDYKLFRSANVSEIPAFTSKREFCYTGFEHLQVKVTAMVEKRRLSEVYSTFNGLIGSTPYSVTIDGINIGNHIITDYEISGSEDNYLYKISLSLCNAQ